MKKIIIALLFLSLLFVPVVSRAEQPVAIETPQPTISFEEMKQQLIALILEQIKILQAQLNEMLAQQKENNNLVRGLQESVATATALKAKDRDITPPVVNMKDWRERLEKNKKGVLSGNACIEVGVYDPNPKNTEGDPVSSGFDKFELYIDNFLLKTTTTLKELNDCIEVDTNRFGNGNYTILGKAYDKDGNVGNSSIIIEIKN